MAIATLTVKKNEAKAQHLMFGVVKNNTNFEHDLLKPQFHGVLRVFEKGPKMAILKLTLMAKYNLLSCLSFGSKNDPQNWTPE